jgi:hypothetical protein
MYVKQILIFVHMCVDINAIHTLLKFCFIFRRIRFLAYHEPYLICEFGRIRLQLLRAGEGWFGVQRCFHPCLILKPPRLEVEVEVVGMATLSSWIPCHHPHHGHLAVPVLLVFQYLSQSREQRQGLAYY